MRFAIFALLAVTVPAFAEPKDKPALYFATKAGDKLAYEARTGDTIREHSNTVTAVEEKDGEVIVSLSNQQEGFPATTSKMKVSDKGLWMMEHGGAKFPVPGLMLKLPMKAGDSWEARPKRPGTLVGATVAKVVGEEEVEVPAGKYKSIRVESRTMIGETEIKMTQWYAPGIGNVKMVASQDGSESIIVLKKFTPGK